MYRRHVFGRLGFQELLETPGEGGGGGGDGWPAFDVPEGVGRDEPPAGQDPPARQPQQPARGAAGSEPPNRQPQGQPGPQGGQPRQNLPDYRLSAIEQREAGQREEARINELVSKGVRQVLSQALGLQPAEQADPRQARLRETILGLFPELKDVVANHKAILEAANGAPAMREAGTAYWNGVAARSLESLHTGVAKLLVGADKTSADLDPDSAADVQNMFVRWCEGDKSGGRVMRYEAQDPALVPEFLRMFQTRYIDPARRVTVAARGAQRHRHGRREDDTQIIGGEP
jgi:hypothetical protein